ncbi:Alpha/Beta hydrolase protein [Talaromyces proteolyticus]|uniref:Alpha/Beta hydrolase protein n=1 Tax=Talaromyces proteolyticus TaxID=1131652 RepID=A0AAD4KS32_9EURO|nr:Alpha/Beta hydrolase protein [Talaromyces proteolyticus]KAH8699124.1 Alpha/Beta hydrolase protein [Talaromyces proteolyticus]
MDVRSLENPDFSAFLDSQGPRRLPPCDVKETKYTITSYDGVNIDIYHFVRNDHDKSEEPQPALIHAHGGGLVACSISDVSRPTPARIAAESGVQCFSVEYRMAPEFPFPTPLEDCYAALKWVVDNADELNVSKTRIGLIGESGGACLVAGLSLLARDRKLSHLPKKQILIYPMLDNRSSQNALSRPDDPRSQYFSNFIQMNEICWNAYLGYTEWESLNPDIRPYACPARTGNFAGLPSTYIDVGSLDLFRDESVAFAAELTAANVDVEFHLYDGVPHVFDIIAPNIPITKNAKDNRLRAIRSI